MRHTAVYDSDILHWATETHLDEAGYLLGARATDLTLPGKTLKSVQHGTEERFAANIDGLQLGGTFVATDLLLPAIKNDDPVDSDTTAAATYAYCCHAPKERLEIVLRCLSHADPDNEQAQGIVAGLQLLDRSDVGDLTREALYSSGGDTHASFLAIMKTFAVHPGPIVEASLQSADVDLQLAALGVAGRINAPHYAGYAERLIESSEPKVHDLALEVALAGRSRVAWNACLRGTQEHGPSVQGMELCGLLGSTTDHQSLLYYLGDTQQRAAALWGLGFTGRAEAAEACLAWIDAEDSIVAKLAAEAFCAITGLAPDDDNTQDTKPDDNDVDNELHPDTLIDDAGVDLLPLLDRHAVESWWYSNRNRFSGRQQRFLYGAKATPSSLVASIRDAPARRRHAHARELFIRSDGQHYVDTMRMTSTQYSQIDALSGLQINITRSR